MTDEERFEKAGELYDRALDLSPSDREAFFEQACADDSLLLREVRSLFGFESETAEELVGRYRIVEEIGSGGMGVVHLAERVDDYRQRVALKRFRGEAAPGPELLRRFQSERQILATLQHPSIVRLLDGGSTRLGRPFLVMEYVEGGVRLDQYCWQHQLPLRERVELFLQVCDAVHYAHQKLVVHRDLKPTNVLVTNAGEVKLLDFGLAKVLDEAQWDEAAKGFSVIGRQLGTPGYASPEQLRGEPSNDVRADVYALGAILYKMLSGVEAFTLKSFGSWAEFKKTVCESDPYRPSEAALRIRSGAGPIEPPETLSKLLKGDLDAIVTTAMRRETDERYAGVAELADDLRAWLDFRPIRTRLNSKAYVISRFARRHRVGITIAAFATLVPVIFLWQQREVSQANTRAQQNLYEVRNLARTLLSDVYDAIEELPGAQDARDLLLKSSLEALERLAADAKGDASFQSNLALDLARAYIRGGDLQRQYSGRSPGEDFQDTGSAEKSYQQAVMLLQTARGPEAQVVLARAHQRLAELKRNLPSGIAEAKTHMVEASSILSTASGNEARLIEALVARLEAQMEPQTESGANNELRHRLQKAINILEQISAAEPRRKEFRKELAETYERLAEVALRDGFRPPPGAADFWRQWQPSSAEEFRRAIEDQRSSLKITESLLQSEPKNFDAKLRLAKGQAMLGKLLLQNGDPAGAEQAYRSALTRFSEVVALYPSSFHLLGEEAKVRIDLSQALMGAASRTPDAVREVTEGLRQLDRHPNPADIGTLRERARAYGILGNLQYRHANLKVAFETLHKAVELHGQLLSRDRGNRSLQRALMLDYRDLAFIRGELGDREPALRDYNSAIALGDALLSREDPGMEWIVAVASVYNDRSELLSEAKEALPKAYAGLLHAKALLEPACSSATAAFHCRFELAITYGLMPRALVPGKSQLTGRDYYERAIRILQDLFQRTQHRDVGMRLAEAYMGMAQQLFRQRELEVALGVLQKARDSIGKLYRSDPQDLEVRRTFGYSQMFLADLYTFLKQRESAVEYYSECITALDYAEAGDEQKSVRRRCLVQRGTQHLQAGNWEGAKVDFQAALNLEREAGVLFQLARAQEGDGDLKSARLSLEEAIGRVRPTDKNLRTLIESRLREIRENPKLVQ